MAQWDSRMGRIRLWVRFLAVSDIYPMFIEPMITWVSSGFSGYIWLDTKQKKCIYIYSWKRNFPVNPTCCWMIKYDQRILFNNLISLLLVDPPETDDRSSRSFVTSDWDDPIDVLRKRSVAESRGRVVISLFCFTVANRRKAIFVRRPNSYWGRLGSWNNLKFQPTIDFEQVRVSERTSPFYNTYKTIL